MSLRSILLGLALTFASISPSSAITVTVTYSGSATGQYSDFEKGEIVHFSVAATETYSIDGPITVTPVGIEVHGNASGSMLLDGIGSFFAYANYLEILNTGIVNVYPGDNGFQRMYVVNGQGMFQFSPCPGHLPCGFFGSSNVTVEGLDLAPVPSPIAGAGLPGLLMTIAGFIGWRRSRRLLLEQ